MFCYISFIFINNKALWKVTKYATLKYATLAYESF